jgi:hypothetical protein
MSVKLWGMVRPKPDLSFRCGGQWASASDD